jgi:hypothetical protein
MTPELLARVLRAGYETAYKTDMIGRAVLGAMIEECELIREEQAVKDTLPLRVSGLMLDTSRDGDWRTAPVPLPAFSDGKPRAYATHGLSTDSHTVVVTFNGKADAAERFAEWVNRADWLSFYAWLAVGRPSPETVPTQPADTMTDTPAEGTPKTD